MEQTSIDLQKGKWKNRTPGKVPVKVTYIGSNRFKKRVPITATRMVLPQHALSGEYEIDFAKLEESGSSFPTPDNVNRPHSHTMVKVDAKGKAILGKNGKRQYYEDESGHPVSELHKDPEVLAEHRDERETYARNYYKVQQVKTEEQKEQSLALSEITQKIKQLSGKKKLNAGETAELEDLKDKVQERKDVKAAETEKANWLDKYNVKREFGKKITVSGKPIEADTFYLLDGKSKVYLFKIRGIYYIYSKQLGREMFSSEPEAFARIGEIFEDKKLRNKILYKMVDIIEKSNIIQKVDSLLSSIPMQDSSVNTVSEYVSGENRVLLEMSPDNYRVSINGTTTSNTGNVREALNRYYTEISKTIAAHADDRNIGLDIFGSHVIQTNRNVIRQMADLGKSAEVEFLKDLDFSTLNLPYSSDFISKHEPQGDVFEILPMPNESNTSNDDHGIVTGRKDLKEEEYCKEKKADRNQEPIEEDKAQGNIPAIISKAEEGLPVRQEESQTPKEPYQQPVKVKSTYTQKLKVPENAVIEQKDLNSVLEIGQTISMSPDELEHFNKYASSAVKESLNQFIEKAEEKVYLTEGETPPENVNVQQGKRGGKFYFPFGRKKTEEPQKEDTSNLQGQEETTDTPTEDQNDFFSVSAVSSLQPSVAKFKSNMVDVLKQLPNSHTYGASFHLVEEEDLVDSRDSRYKVMAQFEPSSRVISISRIVNDLPEKVLMGEYRGLMPGGKHAWKLVALHELGHRVMDNPEVLGPYKRFVSSQNMMEESMVGVTKYALTDHRERFAEAYLFYTQNPSYLKKEDPKIFDFMKDVVFEGKEYDTPIVKEETEKPEGSRWMEDGKYFKDMVSSSQTPEGITKSIEYLIKAGHPSLKYSGHYVPIRTVVRGKNGLLTSAIRWKKFEAAGLEKIKSPTGLKGVRRTSETPSFTQTSEVKQTLFYLADEIDISALKEDKYIPPSLNTFLGDGVYLFGDLDEATTKAEEVDKVVLPVKVNITKIYQTTLDNAKDQNIGELKNSGYDALIINKDEPQKFDIFVFNSKDIAVIGDDEIDDEVVKSIEKAEYEEYLDLSEGGFELYNGEAITKAVIQTPQKEGRVDYGAVPIGASIWITVTKPSSPLSGRHMLITKRPDGLFAITGGAGSKQLKDKYGIESHQDALRHLVITGTPQKTKKEKESDAEEEEKKKENAPLIERKKELQQLGKEEIDQAFNDFNDALQIKSTDSAELKKHREEIKKYAKDNGLEEDKADDYANTFIRHYTKAEKIVSEKRRRDAGLKMYTKLRAMKEGASTADAIKELNDELAFRPISVTLPDPSKFSNLTKEEIDNKIGNIIDEKVAEVMNPNPLDKTIDTELASEGIVLNDADKDKNAQTVTIGENIIPLEIKNEQALRDSFEKFKKYYSLKKEISEVKRLIKPSDLKKITPSLLENMRLDVRSTLGESISDEEIDTIRQSYDEQWQKNNSSISFYNAIGEFWNDEKSLREKLNRVDNSFGGYVNSGANSALAALTGKYTGERIDSTPLVDKTNIETASLIIAFQLRDKYANDLNKYNSVIQNITTLNTKNQISAEKEALDKHEKLKAEYASIQKEKAAGTLSSKVFTTEAEINNLIDQKKNLGTALGSLQASAAFLEALQVARDAKDRSIEINFGEDLAGAESRLNELGLEDKAYIDPSDTKNIKLITGTKALNRFARSQEVIKNNFDENEAIKTNMADTFEDEDGKIFVNKYDVPLWKDEYIDSDGNKQKHNFRVEQRNDIDFLKKMGNGVITRVTGAGKTNTVLGFFANKIAEDKNWSGISVVPKGHVKQWVDEARRFTDLDVVEIPEGMNKDERANLIAGIKPNQVAIMSHKDAIVSYYPLEGAFLGGAIKGMSIDEPQELASRSASGNMSASVRKLMKLPSENRVVATATPARDNLIESYDLVNWISHKDKRLGPRTRFQKVYGGYGSGTNAQDATLQQMIFKEISPFISGDKLTNPNFKVNREVITVKKSDKQSSNMKNIESNADNFIEDEKNKFINNILANPDELKKWEKKYGNAWKTQASTQSNKLARQKLVDNHADNLDGISEGMTWQDNPKINEAISRIGSDKNQKHVIFLDNDKQRRAIQDGLSSLGLKANQIKNIAATTTSGSISGKDMSQRVKDFRTDKGIKVIFIDKNSASGYNLQEGNTLHVLGTPSDAANYLQAQGRIARMPRKGDVKINTYRYSDVPFEDQKWNRLDTQLKILRAVAPGMFAEKRETK